MGGQTWGFPAGKHFWPYLGGMRLHCCRVTVNSIRCVANLTLQTSPRGSHENLSLLETWTGQVSTRNLQGYDYLCRCWSKVSGDAFTRGARLLQWHRARRCSFAALDYGILILRFSSSQYTWVANWWNFQFLFEEIDNSFLTAHPTPSWNRLSVNNKLAKNEDITFVRQNIAISASFRRLLSLDELYSLTVSTSSGALLTSEKLDNLMSYLSLRESEWHNLIRMAGKTRDLVYGSTSASWCPSID